MSAVLKTAVAVGAISRVCRLAGAQSSSQLLVTQLPDCHHKRTMSKHWNPKFRMLRGKKIIKVELPNFNEDKEAADLTPNEMRAKLKEKGILPPRPWQERPINISCTGGVFEEYVPPEGDGKVSIVSKTGAKQRVELLEKKAKSMMAVRKIRTFDEDFDVSDFAEDALNIYQEAHQALARLDKAALHKHVTELAYPKMIQSVRSKTVHWQLLKSLEPARVVHVRHTNVISKDNVYAQVTVRLHTQQLLAIYDRFGRLMYGSEVVAKDVLEYVVFEKHLADEYGRWRVHSKIVPDWMPAREPVGRTWRVEPTPPAPPPPPPPAAAADAPAEEAAVAS
ncbi:probable 39S ribosomal protein L45, mitochondrial [Pollicipes pollicipes]|uniref:probable 39S ribosomal protein L45, mitochondrial n=1 Tax=Pollicipes pollicipes TaxID=41117 RepID=UPI001884A49A|nr:probable 39S ribosomal protein L45, mitochondrial [Pollicipes pollicipes]XP_037078091.1 probable 39S ribosomal protein L45, mitochondrial [Pollicipes pollicipes]XP_037078092.1 probable 39S ribosomal protein L45, mitochondrial [Pollicipes pollicipes]